MSEFKIGDRVVYKNGFGRPSGVGVISDITGSTAKVEFFTKETDIYRRIYTYTDVKNLKLVEEENNG